MLKFEWDEDKNKKNLLKHKVDFTDAKDVFEDEYGIEQEADYRGEYRLIRIGKTAARLILFVVYTMRGLVIRIISARQASKREIKLYLKYKFQDNEDENNDN